MTKIFQILSLLIITTGYTQTIRDLKKMEGIWIADSYFKEFEKTKSAISSKNSFGHSDFVGLRINTNEIKNNQINIGVGILHDHLLNPEVSEYIIIDKDTIYEQYFFKIKLNQVDSSGFVKTSLNDNISFDIKKQSIVLINLNEQGERQTVIYKRVSKKFKSNYQYPNPIYYFTNKVTLEGTYIVKDSLNKVVENKLSINSEGIIKSKGFLNNKKANFSTDIYCGPPSKDDFVLFCDREFSEDLDCKGFIYKRINDTVFRLYNRKWIDNNGRETYVRSSYKFEFIKIK